MKLSDEMLMAYADGEVDDVLRAQIEAAIALDPQLAAAVEQHRRLRMQLRHAFDDTLHEPIPDRLLAALGTTGTSGEPASNVIDLAGAASARHRAGWHWGLREWGALAATFVIGVSLGFALLPRGSDIVATGHGELLARGVLATALSNQLAGTQHGDEPVQIGLSFTTHAGDICRTFAVRGEHLAGMACRATDGWRVDLLTAAEVDSAAETTYRQAGSSVPAVVLALVDQQIIGAPFDAAAEAQARQSGWKR
jgi:hypothetical protein